MSTYSAPVHLGGGSTSIQILLQLCWSCDVKRWKCCSSLRRPHVGQLFPLGTAGRTGMKCKIILCLRVLAFGARQVDNPSLGRVTEPPDQHDSGGEHLVDGIP